MVDLNTSVFVVALNVDELNAPGKRQSLDFLKSQKLFIRDVLNKNTENLEVQKNGESYILIITKNLTLLVSG